MNAHPWRTSLPQWSYVAPAPLGSSGPAVSYVAPATVRGVGPAVSYVAPAPAPAVSHVAPAPVDLYGAAVSHVAPPVFLAMSRSHLQLKMLLKHLLRLQHLFSVVNLVMLLQATEEEGRAAGSSTAQPWESVRSGSWVSCCVVAGYCGDA